MNEVFIVIEIYLPFNKLYKLICYIEISYPGPYYICAMRLSVQDWIKLIRIPLFVILLFMSIQDNTSIDLYTVTLWLNARELEPDKRLNNIVSELSKKPLRPMSYTICAPF
jgi:hypothetical protein